MKRILPLFLFFACSLASAQDKSVHDAARQLEIFNAVFKELHLNYVDTLNSKELIEKAIDYMLYQLDPYTEFYPKEAREDVRQMTTGNYGGIGSPIHFHEKHRRSIFVNPFEGMPADEAGVKTGDVIMRIDGKDMGQAEKGKENDYNAKISESLRGVPGTVLELTVQRPGEDSLITLNLTRRAIEQPSVAHAALLQDSIAYILLTGFTRDTHKEFRKAFVNLKEKGAKRLIIDLRFNPGGLIGEAREIVNLFLPRGKEVVAIKGKNLERPTLYMTEHKPLDETMPIAVVVNGESASASEITSGVLQDYDRAVVVGERTFGKGLVQETHDLAYGATLKLTTNKYFIPSGRCVQALDYHKRDASGRPTHLPDSLSKTFLTANGRLVKDGGGITPDIVVKGDSVPNLIAHIANSDLLIDYVVDYRRKHETIAPAEHFTLTGEEYDDFRTFLRENGFTYDRQTEKHLNFLREIARFEGYEEATHAEFDALEKKLKHNEDADFSHWEKEIRKVVESRIIEEYYYASGRYAYALRDDAELRAALKVLCDDAAYRKVLQPKKK